MEPLIFETESSYIDYLESLVGRPIVDIVKNGSRKYLFKIDSYWYLLSFNIVVGTAFKDGDCLDLHAGENKDSIERLYLKQFAKNHALIERINKIFHKLETVHIQSLLIDNAKLFELTKNLSELFETIDSIERFSSHFFVISKGNTKFSIKKIEEFEYGQYQQHLKIMKIVGDHETKVDLIRGEVSANSILNSLNFFYYANKIERITDIKSILSKHI